MQQRSSYVRSTYAPAAYAPITYASAPVVTYAPTPAPIAYAPAPAPIPYAPVPAPITYAPAAPRMYAPAETYASSMPAMQFLYLR